MDSVSDDITNNNACGVELCPDNFERKVKDALAQKAAESRSTQT